MTGINATDDYVLFTRSRGDAKRRGCPMEYHVPMGRVIGAELEATGESGVVRVQVAGADPVPDLSRDPHAMEFAAADLESARAVVDQINLHAAGESADPHVAFASDPNLTRGQERLYRWADVSGIVSMGAAGCGLVFAIIALVGAGDRRAGVRLGPGSHPLLGAGVRLAVRVATDPALLGLGTSTHAAAHRPGRKP